ncbi:MAG: RdgB/HAM1 family non-canonical purine NTP pyrophosphatase [Planctomycetota bacterium]|jgi:XTP/dITP diphosphohydrolase
MLNRLDTIVVATRNAGKLAEIEVILEKGGLRARSIEGEPLAPDVEETGTTFQENARLKAVQTASALGTVVLGEDSGLEVDALDGSPGVFSARFAGEPQDPAANNEKLLAAMKDVDDSRRTARYRCAVCLASPEGIIAESEGATSGSITRALTGEGGFGYDPLFLSSDLGVTFGQAQPDQKHAVSHRGRALEALLSLLRGMHLVTD